jgi:enoyl-CoA hydratase
MAPPVSSERRGAVLVITIDRPESRNSIDPAAAEAIAAACETLDSDPELRVGILTGSGGYFCSGMDLKAFSRDGRPPRVPGRGFAGIVEAPPQKPLIAAIEGFALAGGLEVALACDILVAARGASFGLPEVKRGVVAVGGGLLRLPRLIPRAIALELSLTGDPIDAARAAELGLVNRLCEPGEALAEALRIAETIAANAPLSVAVSKRILTEADGWGPADEWERQRELAEPVMQSADAREGATAFAEKRPPRWRGR